MVMWELKFISTIFCTQHAAKLEPAPEIVFASITIPFYLLDLPDKLHNVVYEYLPTTRKYYIIHVAEEITLPASSHWPYTQSIHPCFAPVELYTQQYICTQLHPNQSPPARKTMPPRPRT
jgi:hypothetical protein